MKNIRIYLMRFVLFTIAFQILNLSVYGSEYVQQSTDDNGNTILSTNQIDSFVEYVVEEVVVHKNIFPENKSNHTKNTNKIIKTPYQIFVPLQLGELVHTSHNINKEFHIYNVLYFPLYYAEIFPKPPNEA